MPTEPDHYQHIAEVKQVAWGGWKAGVFIFLLKLVAPLHSFLHHLAMAMADGSDDDITQVLFLVRETHPLRKALSPTSLAGHSQILWRFRNGPTERSLSP